MKASKYIFLLIFCGAVLLAGCGIDGTQNTIVNRPKISVSEESELGAPQISDYENKQQSAPFYTNYSVNMEVNPSNKKVTTIEKISYKNQTGAELDKVYIQFNIAAFSNSYETQPFFEEHKNKVYKYGKSYSDYLINLITVNNETVDYNIVDRYIEIVLVKPLPFQENIDITMQFECTIPKICHRIGSNDEAMWFGNFIPLMASFENGKWQLSTYYPAGDPFVSEAANFDVTITTPKNYHVYGSGVEKTTENETNKTTRMTINMVRDFAFVISNKYNVERVTSNYGVEIDFYYYSDNLAATRINRILEIAKTAVDYYYAKIGAFPFQQIGIAEAELFIAGGMEYPNFILLDSSYIRTTMNFETVAHEIAHQWFYNVVGNNQVTEAWLDEGLTTYVQAYMFDSSLAVERKMNEIYGQLTSGFEETQNYALTTNLGVFKTWREYYNVNYSRAALMFYALHKKMGGPKFDEFLKTYYSEFSFKTAYKNDIVSIASDIYGEELDSFFEAWILWKNMPDLP